MNFNLSGEQQPLSAFWPRSAPAKSSQKENKRPQQYSRRNKQQESIHDPEPPAKRRKRSESRILTAIEGRSGRASEDRERRGSQTAKCAGKSSSCGVGDVIDLAGQRQSDEDRRTSPSRFGATITAVENSLHISGNLSHVSPTTHATRIAMLTPPPTSNPRKRKLHDSSSSSFFHHDPLLIGATTNPLPTPGTSIRRTNIRSRPSRLQQVATAMSRSPEQPIHSCTSTPSTSSGIARLEHLSFDSVRVSPTRSRTSYNEGSNSDPFAPISQNIVPSSQPITELPIPPRLHTSSEPVSRVRRRPVPTFPMPDLLTGLGSSSTPSTRRSSLPEGKSDFASFHPSSVVQSVDRPVSVQLPFRLSREIIPSSQSQPLLAPNSSPLAESTPLPPISSDTMLYDGEERVPSSQSQAERELMSSHTKSQLLSNSTGGLGLFGVHCEQTGVKRREHLGDSSADLTLTPQRPPRSNSTVPETPQRSQSCTPTRRLSSAMSLRSSPSHSGSVREEPIRFTEEHAWEKAPKQRDKTLTPSHPSSKPPSANRTRQLPRRYSQRSHQVKSSPCRLAGHDSATESESENDVINFVTDLNKKVHPDDNMESDDDVPVLHGKVSSQHQSRPSISPIYSPSHSHQPSSYNDHYMFEDDIVQAGAPLSIPSDDGMYSRLRMLYDEGGTLPPEVTDFLDMFQGSGNGSYPADFPESLR